MIGKIGTDIEDNKCSWLICTALQLATEEQKETIKVCGCSWLLVLSALAHVRLHQHRLFEAVQHCYCFVAVWNCLCSH